MAKQKKRADGRYCKNITLGRNEDGSLKRKMIYANTKAELDLKVADLLLQREKGTIIDDKNKTVDKWADEWLETYTSNLKDSTKYNHKKIINKYIKPNFKGLRLKDLKQYKVQQVLNDIEAPSVPKKFLITLNKILNAAVQNDYIVKNVANGLVAPDFRAEPKKPLSDEQIKIIKATDHELQNICIFLIYSGLRLSELINLTRLDIDLKEKLIYIRGDVKTEYSERVVPMFDPAYVILKQLTDSRIKNIDAKKDYVFLHKGKKYTENVLSKKRYKYCKVVGFDFTFHQLRHTFATMCYNAGIDVKQIQEWLGHANFATTMDIYTHLAEQNNKTATDKMNEYLKTV